MAYIARLETRHFEFMTMGETASQALTFMRATWDAHREQYGKDRVVEFDHYEEEVKITEMEFEAGYRDGELIWS